MPVYNTEAFLSEALESIINQTATSWELIIVDDCSSDNSSNIAKLYSENDKRIQLVCNDKNYGAAISRNIGIDKSSGRYITFLDADDVWNIKKLEIQIKFMKDNNCAFSYTSYEFADKDLNTTGKKVIVPKTITYNQALKNTTIWTCTVMLDSLQIQKEDMKMKDLETGEDSTTWWSILKKIDKAYGVPDVLSIYRRTSNSQSSNKLRAIRNNWIIYRKIENLNFIYATICFTSYCINATRRRLGW